MSKEKWKKIKGFSNYYVSDHGRILSKKGPFMHYLKPNKRLNVVLTKNSKHYSRILSRLILFAFVGKPKNGDNFARHLDDNTKNNYLNNLAWGSAQDNYNDAVRNGIMGPGSPTALKIAKKRTGVPLPLEVRQKISATKKANYKKQNYNTNHDPITGKFT